MNVRIVLASSAVLGLLAAGEVAGQTLSLRIEKGLVTLDAQDVTVDEVLARWIDTTGLNVVSKSGQGSDIPVSLHLEGVPERDALRMLLRDLSGYIMGERVDPRTGLVTIDRLMILPQSAAQASTAVPPSRVPPSPRPSFQIGRQQIALPAESADVEEAEESDDDTPRELAPGVGPTFAGTAGARVTLGAGVSATPPVAESPSPSVRGLPAPVAPQAPE